MNLSTIRKIQKFLLATFCASVAVFILNIFIVSASLLGNPANGANTGANVTRTPVPTNNPPTNNTAASDSSKPAEEGGYGLMIIGGVTFLTSLTSLLGFISTTLLAWRKEKRDAETVRFDNEKKELELEKLRWEIEKIKTDGKESKPARSRKPKKSGE